MSPSQDLHFLDSIHRKRSLIYSIAALRIFVCLVTWLIIDAFIVSDTIQSLNLISITLAGCLATRLTFSRLTTIGFTICLLILGGILYFILPVADYIPILGRFTRLTIAFHGDIAAVLFVITAGTTWCFWRFPHTVTIELFSLAGLVITLLSAHRDYRFDMVKVVNDAAWSFGVQPLVAYVVIGGLLSCLLTAYLAVATLPGIPRPAVSSKASELPHRAGFTGRILGAGIFILLLWLSSIGVYWQFEPQAQSRTANGVRSESEKGMSPLDFNNSIGGSRYPTALLRLDSDYKENPFAPMLFLREAALSDLQGNEMVISGNTIDQDVSFIKPGEFYKNEQFEEQASRVPVTQSLYLLTPHKLAIGLDRPIAINPLSLPEKNSRFLSAFKVYSLSPAFTLSELDSTPVGNPKWSPEIRDLYLRQHSDPRYASRAQEIIGGQRTEAGKAFALTNYLINSAIYTLTPNHDYQKGEDPVAPFLFGDMRGYCVHFAHALVYMLRAVGLPARIGTGYLTDFSQAKDGHILLRNSDRHAWAEVYFQDIGWIPFDVQPTQIENHADSPMDQDQLAELMGALEPGEELLPSDLEELEPSLAESDPLALPGVRSLLGLLIVLVATLYMLKLLALNLWRFPASTRSKFLRAYRASIIRLADLGIEREVGETLSEFSFRVAGQHNLQVLSNTALRSAASYSPHAKELISYDDIRNFIHSERKGFSVVPWKKRLFAALNPLGISQLVKVWRR